MKNNQSFKISIVLIAIIYIIVSNIMEMSSLHRDSDSYIFMVFIRSLTLSLMVNSVFLLLKKDITYKRFLLYLAICPILNIPFFELSAYTATRFLGSLIASIAVYIFNKKYNSIL